jgi:hypothetical protein
MKHHIVNQTDTCGDLREVLPGSEYSPDIAIKEHQRSFNKKYVFDCLKKEGYDAAH